MDYDRGLQALKEWVADKGADLQQELATWEERFRKNERDERLFGGSENTRQTRSQIIYQLNGFALRELKISFTDLCQGATPPVVTGPGSVASSGQAPTAETIGKPSPQFLTDLRQGIVDTFSTSDLKILCADLGIDYDNIPGDTKEVRTLELIAEMNRAGRLAELVQACNFKRPNHSWPQWPPRVASGNS